MTLRVFQSTPPRGRRGTTCRSCDRLRRFQSTPPRGRRDPRRRKKLGGMEVSIHASAREASVHLVGTRLEASAVSIHASAREASRALRLTSPGCNRFNPRLRAGGELLLVRQQSAESEFQSTPPRGRRVTQELTHATLQRFQSTPPRGRRVDPPRLEPREN